MPATSYQGRNPAIVAQGGTEVGEEQEAIHPIREIARAIAEGIGHPERTPCIAKALLLPG